MTSFLRILTVHCNVWKVVFFTLWIYLLEDLCAQYHSVPWCDCKLGFSKMLFIILFFLILIILSYLLYNVQFLSGLSLNFQLVISCIYMLCVL